MSVLEKSKHLGGILTRPSINIAIITDRINTTAIGKLGNFLKVCCDQSFESLILAQCNSLGHSRNGVTLATFSRFSHWDLRIIETNTIKNSIFNNTKVHCSQRSQAKSTHFLSHHSGAVSRLNFYGSVLYYQSGYWPPHLLTLGNENVTYYGSSLDLMDYLAEHFNFTYKFEENNVWGVEKQDGSWNGMVSKVIFSQIFFFIKNIDTRNKLWLRNFEVKKDTISKGFVNIKMILAYRCSKFIKGPCTKFQR